MAISAVCAKSFARFHAARWCSRRPSRIFNTMTRGRRTRGRSRSRRCIINPTMFACSPPSLDDTASDFAVSDPRDYWISWSKSPPASAGESGSCSSPPKPTVACGSHASTTTMRQHSSATTSTSPPGLLSRPTGLRATIHATFARGPRDECADAG